ncbi:Transcription factor [Mycena sanguinolenta]|uniref:Transcription factor n=1 Tax=Mycena sanguinolenta TaxID=230812 RepID=A0A8H7DG70_9AGAR|nr:Transcription factor [Mycena sanguinolenta]
MDTRCDDDDFVTSRLRLPVLGQRGESFVTWKTQVKSHITGIGKARYLDGRATAPVKPMLADNPDKQMLDEHKRALVTYDEELDEWEINNEKIRTILFQSIHETHQIRIANHTSARESWNTLCKLYEHQGELHARSIVDQMHQLKCPENECDPRATLDQLDLLITEHASVGGTLSDSEKKTIVLHLLPNTWRENIRTILANAESMRQLALQLNPTGVPPLYTADMLVEAIRHLARDDAAIHGTTAPSGGAALAAGTHDVCNNCGHRGHWARDFSHGNRNGRGGSGGGRGSGSNNDNNDNNDNTANTAGAGTGNHSFAFSAAMHVATDFTKLDETGIVSHGFTALLDSGANRHYCPSREHFVEYQSIDAVPIRSADNHTFYATRSGKVPMTVLHNGRRINMMLLDVLHAPEMPLTLVSVSRMARSGHAVHVEKDSAHVLTPDRTTLEVHAAATPTPNPVSTPAVNTACMTLTLHEFHCRMGHADVRGLQNMISKGLVTGVKLTDMDEEPCRGCNKGMLRHEPPHTRSNSSEKVYSDDDTRCSTWGPTPTPSLGHKTHAVLFLDGRSDEAVIVGLEKKSEAAAAYKQYQTWAKVHRRTTTGESETHLQNPSAPGSNAERVLQTLLAHARTMLHLANLPTSLWLEAVSHAAWLRNRTETAKTIGSTPHERATGNKPDLSQIRRFGANVWVKLGHTSKIDVQAKPCRWIGIDAHAKGHRIYWPEQNKITVEQNVRFEGEQEDITYPSVPIEGEMGEMSARDARNTPATTPDARNPPAATPDAAPEVPSDKSVPENPPEAQHAPLPAPEAPDPIEEPPSAAPETIRPPSPARAPDPPRTTRMRKPTQWLRDIADGTGTIGGRGATKLPPSVVPTREPTANTIFENDSWLHRATAFTAVRAAVAVNEMPLPSTSTRDQDAPSMRDESPNPKNLVRVTCVTFTYFPCPPSSTIAGAQPPTTPSPSTPNQPPEATTMPTSSTTPSRHARRHLHTDPRTATRASIRNANGVTVDPAPSKPSPRHIHLDTTKSTPYHPAATAAPRHSTTTDFERSTSTRAAIDQDIIHLSHAAANDPTVDELIKTLKTPRDLRGSVSVWILGQVGAEASSYATPACEPPVAARTPTGSSAHPRPTLLTFPTPNPPAALDPTKYL